MPVVVFKRFQNIRTGLLIGNAGGNVLPCLRVFDVDLLFLIRLFLAHDGFDDCRRKLALPGKGTQFDPDVAEAFIELIEEDPSFQVKAS